MLGAGRARVRSVLLNEDEVGHAGHIPNTRSHVLSSVRNDIYGNIMVILLAMDFQLIFNTQLSSRRGSVPTASSWNCLCRCSRHSARLAPLGPAAA